MITIHDVFVSAGIPVNDVTWEKFHKLLKHVFKHHLGNLSPSDQELHASNLCSQLEVDQEIINSWNVNL